MSIGSDAVYAVEAYLAAGDKKDGSTAIEQISRVYGAQVGGWVRWVGGRGGWACLDLICAVLKLNSRTGGWLGAPANPTAASNNRFTAPTNQPTNQPLLQAVVISIDPKRVYVASPDNTTHHTVKTPKPGGPAS